MRTALLLAAACLPSAAQLITKPAQPSHYLEAVGRRAALLGREDGTFEAWINPIKLVRDFRLSVFFDGSLTPVDLSELAETVHVTRSRSAIVHSHAAFTIRQTWVAAVDEPVLLVWLEIDTNRPLKLRASFIPEMKPMWPASFGGQSSSWDAKEDAFVFSEGLRRFAPVVGSPLWSAHSEQIGHQLPGRRIVADMDVKPENKLVPIVIAGSREAYRKAIADPSRIVTGTDNYYRDLDARTLHVRTPNAELNSAAYWARSAIERGWTCNDGVGCGLVAGFAASGESERPGFAWYFGGDALMNSWSVVDYGDFERARGILEFVRGQQRADGKMQHELTQSAALLDWSKYPYGYYHGDTTPLYIYSVWRYVSRSGDLDFLRASWPSIEKAYQFCAANLDDDGLLSNRKAGAGAVETGALSGKVANDIYLQGVWLAAADAYTKLAAAAGQSPADAAARREHARATLNNWFVPSKNTFAFARLTDGSMYDAQSSWQGLALALGGLDPDKASRAAAAMARPELTTNWGARLFATDSPNYDPLSYNDGSVWPFVTGFAALGAFRHNQNALGLRLLYGTAAMTGLSGAGFVPEYLSGERAQALPHSVPHQLFSSSAVMNPLVSGLLGLDGNALERKLTVAPHLPQTWTVTFDNYRTGRSTVSGEIRRQRGLARLTLTITGDPLEVEFAPGFAPPRRSPASNKVDLEIRGEEPAEAPLSLTPPSPGDLARR